MIQVSANAQCAMCKATAESNPDVGGGLNAGIEYIMIFHNVIEYVTKLIRSFIQSDGIHNGLKSFMSEPKEP